MPYSVSVGIASSRATACRWVRKGVEFLGPSLYLHEHRNSRHNRCRVIDHGNFAILE
jgi:hypothetical protein